MTNAFTLKRSDHIMVHIALAQSESVSLSVMSDFLGTHGIAHQVPLSMGILQARILEWVAMPSLH